MKSLLLFQLIQMVYKAILRPLVQKEVDDTESDIDNLLMEMIDRIFDVQV